MTLWLILTIMTSAAAVLVSAPFVRRFDQRRARAANDVEVYRDQLKEVEREATLGVIDADQAESARVEIKRRLLAADRADGPALPGLAAEERKFAVIAVSGMVILGSVGLYAVTGNPDLRSSGGARRAPSAIPRELSMLESFAEATQAPTFENQRQQRPQTGLPPVDEMIRFSEASEAYAKAIELDPNIAEIRSARIDALVKSADGIVTPDAKRAIEETLKLDPKDTGARFFKGLAKEQEGNRTSALTDWVELLKDANPDEPWVPEVKSRVVSLERDLGIDVAARPDMPKPAAAGGLLETLRAQGRPQMSQAIEKGPTLEDVQVAEAMPPADRSAMIRDMVDGLANRLETSPRDADGWIKLIRSRMVLGETELAKQALARGLEVFAEDKQQRDRIGAAAQQLGLNQ